MSKKKSDKLIKSKYLEVRLLDIDESPLFYSKISEKDVKKLAQVMNVLANYGINFSKAGSMRLKLKDNWF